MTAEAVSDIVGKGAHGASGPAEVCGTFWSLSFFVISKVAAGSEKVVTMLPNNAIVEAVYKVDIFSTVHRKMTTNIKYIFAGSVGQCKKWKSSC